MGEAEPAGALADGMAHAASIAQTTSGIEMPYAYPSAKGS